MAAKRLSADERKKQIADIAATLFAKRGFSGVTTREIAKKARVNEAILFRCFPTKEALYTEIINQKLKVKTEFCDLEAVQKGDDVAVFEAIARIFTKTTDEDSTILRLMLYSALEDHQLASVFLKSRMTTVFDFLLAYISKRTADGVFRDIKPAIAVRAFVGMFSHFIMVRELYKIPKNFEVSNEDAVKHFVQIFLDGLVKKGNK